MKAIQVKYLPATNTKPARFKVMAEGVPHIIIGSNDTTSAWAAAQLALKYGWEWPFVGGTLPNGDNCFVFLE